MSLDLLWCVIIRGKQYLPKAPDMQKARRKAAKLYREDMHSNEPLDRIMWDPATHSINLTKKGLKDGDFVHGYCGESGFKEEDDAVY